MKRILLTALIVVALVIPLLLASCTCQMVGDRIEIDCYGDLMPCADATYDVGSATGRWEDIWAVNYHNLPSGVVSTTYVVATADTNDTSRADYIGDGTADDVQILAALNALPAIGGRVILLEGTYDCLSNILIPAKCTLEGQGWCTVLDFSGASVSQGIVINGDAVCVRNLKAQLADGAGGAGVRPNVVYGQNKQMACLENIWLSGDQTVAQEVISQQNGVYFDNMDDSNIIGCFTESCKRNGIHINNGSDKNKIEGNTCHDNTGHGIYIGDASYCLVSSNECDTDDYGILVYSSTHNSIMGNVCKGNSYYGIVVTHNAEDNTVVGNTCNNNDWGGIRVSDGATNNAITGNTCDYNDTTARHGINVSESNENIVTGNQCSGNGGNGVFIYESSYCVVSGNVCDGNSGDGVKVQGTAAINADYNIVGNNVCYSNTGDGVEIEGDVTGGNTWASRNIVSDNQLSGNGAALNDDGTNTLTDNNNLIP